MNEDKFLLQTIVDHPDEDTPRLDYANHCESMGKVARAEFIRVQCELAKGLGDEARRNFLDERQTNLLAENRRAWLPTEWSFSLYPPETWTGGFVSRVEKQHGRVSREDGISLAEVPTIESLSYAASWANDEGFGHLPAMPNLREFSLWGSEQLSDLSFAKLSSWPKLDSLCLMASGLSDGGMLHLALLKQLRSLTIEDGIENELISDSGLSHLRDLTHLEEFRLTSSNVTGRGFDVIAGLPSLRKLSVGGCGLTEAAIAPILACSTVEELNLNNYLDDEGIGEQLISRLSQLPRLKVLNAIRKDVSTAGYKAIEGLTGLEELHIGSQNFGNDQFRLLLPLRQLRRLYLPSNCFGPKGLRCLRDLPGIRALQIGYQYDGGVLASIAPLKELQWLELDMNGSDEEMVHLRELRSLECLSLRSVYISDVGLARVGCLPNLRYMRAEATRITKEFAWDRRAEWAPNLKGLTINGTHHGRVEDVSKGWLAY